MYRVTLKRGKTYHVGGVTFKIGTPLVVSEELGEYLKAVDVFEVEEAAVLDDVDILDGIHATDLIRAADVKELTGDASIHTDQARPNAPVAEAGPVPPPDIIGIHAPGIIQVTSDQEYQPIMDGSLQANTQPETNSKGVMVDGEGSKGLQRSEEHNVGGAPGGALRDSRRPRKHKGSA